MLRWRVAHRLDPDRCSLAQARLAYKEAIGMTVIARTAMFGQRPGEERFPILVEIGTPYRCGIEPEEWACSVSLEQLYGKSPDIHASDSFQALCLAIRFAHYLLNAFLEEGGILTQEDGERLSLDDYGAMPWELPPRAD